MVVVMEERASEEQVQHVIAQLVEKGFDIHRSTGQLRSVLGAVGGNRSFDTRLIEVMDGVHEVLRITEPYKLASRTFKPERSAVSFDEFRVGGDEVIVMAGPCSVETEEQIAAAAAAVKKAGAKILRGGAFKPRSSPYSFQGLGEDGLRMMRAAADAEGLKVVSEVMDVSQIELVAGYADILQVGARNMQNYTLLRELGKARTPVLLKRGIAATIEEWLLSAEYVLAGGNTDVILCERGIRTFESYTRNTLDISAIPVIQKLSHLPIIADPSHGTGLRDKVAPMARAAIAAGADGLIIEVHPDPDHALSDGAQSIFPLQFDRLMAELRIIAPAIGRSICLEPVARRGWGA
ncbi:MAG: 3-deoxy-7-phosphoheptulonate synthase [Vicinamibacterales bacterium]|jgi:3-deoxy-7-phosphoheptulonate synthase|nr:3-deoxy-7-phosphoheptulonate synthase [Vicinamibacterales bacterium]